MKTKSSYTELDTAQLLILAKQGDAEAQAEAAERYFCGLDYGYDIERDPAQFLYWAHKAAEKNHPEGMCLIGEAYEDGCGVEKNEEKAIMWLTRAAEAGSVNAQCLLAASHHDHEQYDKAWHWYEAAAKQGDEMACYNMGVMCECGEGVPQDYKKAVQYYQKAVRLGSDDALFSLGLLYEDGLGVERNPKKGLECIQNAADNGQPEALVEMGERSLNGTGGVRRNLKDAIWYFEIAAEDYRSTEAMMSLGHIFENPYGARHNYEKAMSYYEDAWDEGEVNAAHEIGMLYFTGQGVKRDEAKAWEWIKKAAQATNTTKPRLEDEK